MERLIQWDKIIEAVSPLAVMGLTMLFMLAALALIIKAFQIKMGRAQPDAALHAAVRVKPVSNNAERVLFAELLRTMPQHFHPNARLLAEVPLLAFMSIDDPAERARVAWQRVDFLIVDPGFNPLVAIEYQGAGHTSRDSLQRDWKKRRILRAAGVPLIEVPQHYTPRDLAEELGDVTGARRPAPRTPDHGPGVSPGKGPRVA